MSHEYSITDFTVISEWEALTADIITLSKQWNNYDEEDRCATIPYKGVPIVISLVSKVKKVPVLTGLPRFSTDGKCEGGYLARVFGVEKFVLARCSDHATSWMSLSTARLISSSLVMAIPSLPVFVEFGEGNVIGLEAGIRYNINMEQASGEVIFRQLLLKYFNGVGRNDLSASYCVTLSAKPNCSIPMVSFLSLPWGCPVDTIASIELMTIFPQVDSGLVIANLLPDAMSAPVWMLSVNRRGEQTGALHRIVNGLVTLLRMAQQPMVSGMEQLYNKTRMHNLMSKSQQNLSQDWTEYMRYIFFSKENDLAHRIVLCSLLAMLEDGIISQRALFEKFGSFWRELNNVLRECWQSLQPIVTGDGGGTMMEEQLLMLSFCIDRERSFMEIPNAPQRKTRRVGGVVLDSLAEKHSNAMELQRRERMERLKSKGKAFVQSLTRTIRHDDDDVPERATLSSDAPPSEGDDFYDAIEGAIPTVEDAGAVELIKSLQTVEISDEGGVGRQGHKHQSDLKLLESEEECMWIPYTQDSLRVPHLAANIDSRERQCAQLVSDMQAFKAANPNSKFADFIRWHSPRDYSVGGGGLSARMSVKGNLWSELWDACTPIPIVKQQLLFDHRREVERALFWFEDVELVELLDSILPLALEVVAKQVEDIGEEEGFEVKIKVPQTVDSETLAVFCDALLLAENQLTLTYQLRRILSINGDGDVDADGDGGGDRNGLDLDPLLKGESILIAQEKHRAIIGILFEHSTSTEKELILSREIIKSNESTTLKSIPKSLYIRLIDSLVEIGLTEYLTEF